MLETRYLLGELLSKHGLVQDFEDQPRSSCADFALCWTVELPWFFNITKYQFVLSICLGEQQMAVSK